MLRHSFRTVRTTPSSRRPGITLALLLAGSVAVPQLASAQDDAPRTHTVRSGDTLWDLARQYLTDPFLWPEIYRLNTAVVEDPHWIYPGEVLRLSGSAAVSAVPETDTPAPEPAADAAGAADPVGSAEPAPLFGRASTGDNLRESVRTLGDQQLRALRPGEFYSAPFLSEERKLPFGRHLGTVTPAQIATLSATSTAMLYAQVAVEAPAGTSYQVGDTLAITSVGREIAGFGEIVTPTGLVRITGTSDGRYVATVIAVYDAIRRGQGALPVERFDPAVAARPIAVANGLEARVAGWPGRQELKAPQDMLFLDKGRQDGVAPGDLFEVRREAAQHPDGTVTIAETMATLQVVRSGERTATAVIVSLSSPDIPAGTRAVQVAKLGS